MINLQLFMFIHVWLRACDALLSAAVVMFFDMFR